MMIFCLIKCKQKISQDFFFLQKAEFEDRWLLQRTGQSLINA